VSSAGVPKLKVIIMAGVPDDASANMPAEKDVFFHKQDDGHGCAFSDFLLVTVFKSNSIKWAVKAVLHFK